MKWKNSFIQKTGYSGPLGATSVYLIRFSQLTGLSVSHFVTQSASLSVRSSVRFQSVSRLDTFSVRCPLVRKSFGWSTVVQSHNQLFIPSTSKIVRHSARQSDLLSDLLSELLSVSQSVSWSASQSVSQSVSQSFCLCSFVRLFIRSFDQSINHQSVNWSIRLMVWPPPQLHLI